MNEFNKQLIFSILSAAAISEREYNYYGRGNNSKPKYKKSSGKSKTERVKRIAEKHQRKKQRKK